MAHTRIKVCGIRDVVVAHAAVAAGADAIGLVFAENSSRRVSVQGAREIARVLPAFVEPVGLFVDVTTQQIRDVADEVGLTTVQLHGCESPDQVVELAPLRVIKALPFSPDAKQFAAILAPWHGVADSLAALLLDAPKDDSPDSLPGGTGRAFDWNVLAEVIADGRLGPLPSMILAGGLTPENVGQAISAVRPYAVDVSSGVEASRGVKDPELISAFCQAVRRADASQS